MHLGCMTTLAMGSNKSPFAAVTSAAWLLLHAHPHVLEVGLPYPAVLQRHFSPERRRRFRR
jgi:hypothetical protein